jgi:alpha-galactosidase
MPALKIALVGAGSRSFGPATVRDILLSEPLCAEGVELRLMDVDLTAAEAAAADARAVAARLKRNAAVPATDDLSTALDGADYVIKAIERRRYHFWSQDFHVPRQHGFRQVYGENGGPGGIFHALRNMGPTVEVARAMERRCPDALLLSYTNPEHKLMEAVSRLTGVEAVGLCHGFAMGLGQVAAMLGMEPAEIDAVACGINHCTWFQAIRDRRTGEDLYPALRYAEASGDELADWHDIGLSRILFRRLGLWPSPGANHIGEYIGWADEFVASELQYFYDPMAGDPWAAGQAPEFIYSLSGDTTRRPWVRPEQVEPGIDERPLTPSGEYAVPIMEALQGAGSRVIDAVNIPNQGSIPNLPTEMIVEMPVDASHHGLARMQMDPLPEPVSAILRTQGAIQRLLVEAYSEQSREKLLQAILLDPTCHSYRNAVAMMDEMLRLQAEALPPLY